MGKVVKLEPTAASKSQGKRRARATAARGVGRQGSLDRRRRPRPDKTALVLGGGGFTGGVYEIGALRALDLLAANSSINQFDVYVGTSAGSFIAALCANGVSPEEMMRVVTRQGKAPFKDINLSDLLRPNVVEFARKGALIPLRAVSLARNVVSQWGAVSLMDVFLGLAEGLPSGAYTGAGIERYLHGVLSEPGRSDDFRKLGCELYITATDLDTCERVVFGVDGSDDVPISTTVRASGALPMVYAPVPIKDRELIDGGIVSTTNLDIAVEAGAKFVVVINPIVPFVNDFATTVRTLRGTRRRRVSDMGFPQIGYQALKLVAHQRLHELAKGWEQRYPGGDIILIQPRRAAAGGRACGSPPARPLAAPALAGAQSALSIADSSRAEAARLRRAMRTCCGSPSGAPSATSTPARSKRAASLLPCSEGWATHRKFAWLSVTSKPRSRMAFVSSLRS